MSSRAVARSRQGGAQPAAADRRPPAATALPLQRVIGNRATAKLLRQPKPPPGKPPPAPRPDFVFIMGEDPKPRRGQPAEAFYTAALAYWKVHLPKATFVTDKRDLDGVLTALASGSGPIGTVYIVSHANEDGTLSFGVEATDTDRHMSVPELREALHPASGTSRLSSVKHRVDSQTRIHIKGCDIGRTKPMLELIDEAFGGAGVVDAPTHEQEYGIDIELEKQARKDFRKEIEDAHPMPPPVDPTLKGPAKAAAKQARDKAVRDRNAAVAADLKARAAEGDRRAVLASHYEAFSGPMFQRKGSTPFTTPELRAEIDRLYPHLSEKRRAALADAMTRRDTGTGLDQHGQRVISRKGFIFSFTEIQDVNDALILFGKEFRKDRFTPTKVETKRVKKPGGFEVTTVVKGKTPDDPDAKREFDATDVFPGDAEMLAQAKAKVPNPDSYAWRIEETHARGNTTRIALAERVVSYLHHESLDPAPHEHFTRPLTDKDFFATSTFGDPKAPAKTAPAKPSPAKSPAVRRLARQPTADNLKAAAPTTAYVKAAVDYYRDPSNAQRSLAEYALFLHRKANDALTSIGVTATKPDWDTNAGFIAQFEPSGWIVRMNPRRFVQRRPDPKAPPVTTLGQLTADEAAGAAGTIYHEVRHAEQHFRMARIGAGRLKPGEKPSKPFTLLAPGIFDDAAKQKLEATKANAALIAEADEWAITSTGAHADASGVVDDWFKEVEASHGIGIDPMHSDVAKRRLDTVIGAWRGAKRQGFVKAKIKALEKLAKPGKVDKLVLERLRAVAKVMDKVDAGWKKVEGRFPKAGLHDRLDLLNDFQHVLYELGEALDKAYRAQPHEADAFAAGDEVKRQFLAAPKP